MKGENGFSVTAWRFLPTASRPNWVVRNFHNLGDGNLETIAADGEIVKVKPGDWIIAVTKEVAVVLYPYEFERNFEPI